MATCSAALGALILAEEPPTFASLPHEVAKLIFARLPLDERLRAREVSPAWREVLLDVRLWTRINLGVGCGVPPRYLTERLRALALLRAACVRAKDGLHSVGLSGVTFGHRGETFALQWLDSASAADKASLRDLVAPPAFLRAERVTALCRALPLCRVRCSVECDTAEALPLLRREPPFALLTIGNLFVDALVDAAISAGIKDTLFGGCGLSQTALPALTRLLQSPGFVCLSVSNLSNRHALLEGPALPAFCEALRNCRSLWNLKLAEVKLWADMAAATQLFAAMEGLPALQELNLNNDRTDATPASQRAAGECLARLIARSTSLRVLQLFNNWLGEAGLEPIFQALRGNSELVELIRMAEQVSADFARDVVLPAVRANTRLRKLFGFCWVDANGWPVYDDEQDPSLLEVQDILAARRQADEEARSCLEDGL